MIRQCVLGVTLGLLLFVWGGSAQKSSFEIGSVKINTSGKGGGTMGPRPVHFLCRPMTCCCESRGRIQRRESRRGMASSAGKPAAVRRRVRRAIAPYGLAGLDAYVAMNFVRASGPGSTWRVACGAWLAMASMRNGRLLRRY